MPLLFLSCMALVNQEETSIPPSLPDLKIISIGYRYHDWNDMIWDDSDGSPVQPELIFSVTVTNQGIGVFDGPLAVAWADNSDDIDWGAYPNFELVSKHKNPILPGDTISFEIDAETASNYAEGNPIRFLLVTQKVMSISNCKTYFKDAVDVKESNYINNVFDCIMQ